MPGLDLSRRFYFEAVRPILEREFPQVEHAAALIGHGSEILGYDDERSRDHQWGPRVQLFMRDLACVDEIAQAMANMLPRTVAGVPTNFGPTEEEGTVVVADLGTAYAKLGRPESAALARALGADDWHAREEALVNAYEAVARRHNELEVTEHVDPTVRPFWGRPFRVLFADRFCDALRAAIADRSLRAVDHQAGAVDSVSDNVDFLDQPSLFRELVGLYDRP